MILSASPLFSNNHAQLLYVRQLPSGNATWSINSTYPVSLFFYLKGSPPDLLLNDAVLAPTYLVKGKGNFVFHDKKTITLAWQESRNIEFIEIRLKKEFLAAVTGQPAANWSTCFHLQGYKKPLLYSEKPFNTTQEAMLVINRILLTAAQQGPLAKLMAEAKTLELLHTFIEQSLLTKANDPLRASHNRLAEKACEYVKNYKGKKNFTIIDLAQMLGTNETTLKQAFKKKYGTTVFRYFHERNMKKALELLKKGVSITETARQCGYSHLSHFSFAFSKEFGMPPSKYQ